MWATIDDTGTACWICESDPRDKVAIGQLGVNAWPDKSLGPTKPSVWRADILRRHMGVVPSSSEPPDRTY
jgi:hypothetical protein